MTVPPRERYFEDYHVGETFEYGDYEITEKEIVEFATRYDPQPFHIDKAAAARSLFGGLIASGWMTGSVMMRMMVENFIPTRSGLGSPGLDEIRWVQPVRPGDRLRVRVTILETVRSRSKPDRGSILALQEGLNQRGEVVMRMKGWGMYLCRDRILKVDEQPSSDGAAEPHRTAS
ncbi:MAG: MaoC family dehydratase [Burkholderiales bacterium]